MPPVYIFRRENRIIEEHLLKGMPLGTMEGFPYELKELNLFKKHQFFEVDSLVEQNNKVYKTKIMQNILDFLR